MIDLGLGALIGAGNHMQGCLLIVAYKLLQCRAWGQTQVRLPGKFRPTHHSIHPFDPLAIDCPSRGALAMMEVKWRSQWPTRGLRLNRVSETTSKNAPSRLLACYPGLYRGWPLDYLPRRLHSWKVVVPSLRSPKSYLEY